MNPRVQFCGFKEGNDGLQPLGIGSERRCCETDTTETGPDHTFTLCVRSVGGARCDHSRRAVDTCQRLHVTQTVAQGQDHAPVLRNEVAV